MHAVRLHAFGPAENLTYEETEAPEPGPGQVRIAVAAAGVHVIDTVFRQGLPGAGHQPPELPTIPGREVAGTVDALGEGTDPAWLGRRVVAHLGMVPGGYAEVAVVAAEKLHEIPEGMDEGAAVAMIGTGRTTMGILRFAEPTADDPVIVTAAAGGICQLIVQYAKNAGATVVGLAGGPTKVDHVRALGADLTVDYKEDDWPTRVRAFLDARGLPGATIAFDSVGGETGRATALLLARGGRHLVFGKSSGMTGNDQPELDTVEAADLGITSQVVVGPPMLANVGGPDPLRTLETESLAEAAAGRLVPAVHRFPLAEAAAAHRALENRGTIGKVVLIP
ncbi:zinc-binding dehydrogenase [Streptomyces sp. NPDC003077]|uniref:zinc-binding dehydrogenase n=1 Tax=Streptomyces sp. NPDC003077 TaxID=3154443 RepID=UPI0033A80C51